MNPPSKSSWPWIPLAEMPASERGVFYDSLNDKTGKTEEFLVFFKEKVWESQEIKIGLICSDGSIISALGPTDDEKTQHSLRPFSEGHINVYFERYFAHRMPTRNFKLQLILRANHTFANDRSMDIGHHLVVNGNWGAYVNTLGACIFRNLQIKKELELTITVNFLADDASNTLINIISADIIKEGIQLTDAFNPIFSIAFSYLSALSKELLSVDCNATLTTNHLTFSATPNTTGILLVEGTYVLLQDWEHDPDFAWKNFQWNQDAGCILKNNNLVPANHMLIRIERCAAT
ncbi:hypothetical protein [Pseudomonas alkylphenolica]|uniref:hypothetical protein n=1 Tax=Pseudomonas alkylphenolica TaxID=237609 RepID=UPI000FAC6F5A